MANIPYFGSVILALTDAAKAHDELAALTNSEDHKAKADKCRLLIEEIKQGAKIANTSEGIATP
jgi:hypothetical protein